MCFRLYYQYQKMYPLAKHKDQKRFKSEAYTRLSKDLKELCGTCRLNIVQNKNRNFNSKTQGLDIKNRFSYQSILFTRVPQMISQEVESIESLLYTITKKQRHQGRILSQREYSSRYIIGEFRLQFFF